jgi:gliding-associated putative ABC transporter substrate-binding component GldG
MNIRRTHKIKLFIFALIAVVLINYLAAKVSLRWDLTADHRYTLSDTTEKLLDRIDQKLYIKVYLKGDFPLDFKRLQQETKQHLIELKSKNKHIHYQFIDPNGMEEKLIKSGLQPSRLTMEESGVFSEKIIFPWAVLNYKGKTNFVPLLLNTGDSQKKQLQNSIENLEYSFSKALSEITSKKTKKNCRFKRKQRIRRHLPLRFFNQFKRKVQVSSFYIKKGK